MEQAPEPRGFDRLDHIARLAEIEGAIARIHCDALDATAEAIVLRLARDETTAIGTRRDSIRPLLDQMADYFYSVGHRHGQHDATRAAQRSTPSGPAESGTPPRPQD